jgi:hypothetical protein
MPRLTYSFVHIFHVCICETHFITHSFLYSKLLAFCHYISFIATPSLRMDWFVMILYDVLPQPITLAYIDKQMRVRQRASILT